MTKRPYNAQIAEEAADWAVRLDAGPLTAAERVDLTDWLRASPLHVEELMMAGSLLNGFTEIDPDRTINLETLVADVGADIVPLKKEHRGVVPIRTPKNKHLGWVLGIAAVFALGFVLTLAVAQFQPQEQLHTDTYSTGLGEQRTVALQDGSLVHLNTQSEVRVLYEPQIRRVELISGEAMFDVVEDTKRPFRVVAGGTIAEALGTIFTVRLVDDTAIVAVVEGAVRVDRAELISEAPLEARPPLVPPAQSAHTKQAVLNAGERARVTEKEPEIAVDQQSLEVITSWRERRLVFEGDRLADIADEFNRYNRQRLIIEDYNTQELRFSGVFDADDPDSFVAFLEFAGGIEAERNTGTIRLSASEAP